MGLVLDSVSDPLTTFLGKSFQRKVNDLEVLCPWSEDGCTWTGTVGIVASHLDDDCQYVEVKCELCNGDIQRRNVQEHKNDACQNRPFTCEYCSYSKTWIKVTSKHFCCFFFCLTQLLA